MFFAAAAVVGLCSFTTFNNSHAEAMEETHVHTEANGAHCRYTVGCSCSGFAPSGPEVYKQYICRRCGHHKSYHK